MSRMSSDAESASGYELEYVLGCPCGERLTGETEDELVETVFSHLRARHPERADEYQREHVLVMAQRLVKG
jgi:predicted small metal-binding protein